MTLLQAGAILGSAVISSRASGKAGDTAADAARAAREQITDAGLQARKDVLDFIPLAQQDLLAGASGAFDLFGQGIGEQQRLLSAGNVGAQGTVGQGFDQVRSALLGLPVDQSSFAPQGISLSQLPQNPFGAGITGNIGQGQQITTGQGTFGGGPNQLNPLAQGLDAAGMITRNPDGTISVNLGGGQAPGSATSVLGNNPSALQAKAFQERMATGDRTINRALNSGGVLGFGTDDPTIGGQNLRNVQDSILIALGAK